MKANGDTNSIFFLICIYSPTTTLLNRKTESSDTLALRIATARKELQRIENFDYVIINRDFHLDETVDKVRAIIDAEHLKVQHRRVNL